MRILLMFLSVVVGAYLLYVLFFFVVQRSILFPRHMVAVPAATMTRYGDEIEQIWLETDGGKVEAWFLPPLQSVPGEPSPALIFGHGNGELIDFWPGEMQGLRELGVGILLVEYPGYGRSQGLPTYSSVTQSFILAYDWLVTRADIDAERIVLMGFSMGGGAVSALAARRSSAALILFSTFTSLRDMAKAQYLPSFLVRDPFDNLAVVRTYANPLLILHGRTDTTIPYHYGKRLHEAAPQSILITLECGHGTCVDDWYSFWQEDIRRFLREAGII